MYDGIGERLLIGKVWNFKMGSLKKQNLVGKKILLVDDKPTNIDVLKQTLISERFVTITALNGKMALEIAHKDKPDLILLDVMMPEMGGFETCRRLKASDATHDIPIIFITAKTGVDDIEEGFSMGCEEYITKPFQVDEVLSRIRTHLLLGKQKRQKVSIRGEDPADISGMKALIVEDNPTNITILRKTLEPFKLNISMAPNGKGRRGYYASYSTEPDPAGRHDA